MAHAAGSVQDELTTERKPSGMQLQVTELHMKATTPGTAQAVCEVNRKKVGGGCLDESVDLYLCAAMSTSQVHDS